MTCGGIKDLSARKVDYLKYIFEHDGSAKTGDLAARFGVDPSTVSKAIREMAENGLLSCAPYERLRLSPSGRDCARFLIKRHRILSLMLTHYGFSPQQACEEVARFESYVTRAAVDRICRMMGHPQIAGCGVITHDRGCMEPQAQETQKGLPVPARRRSR